MASKYNVDDNGFYGEFGGAYVPEILYATVENLKKQYLTIIESEEFKTQYHDLLRDYVGRPSPLYFAKRMSEKYGCQIYLKREDLNHTGAMRGVSGSSRCGASAHQRGAHAHAWGRGKTSAFGK